MLKQDDLDKIYKDVKEIESLKRDLIKNKLETEKKKLELEQEKLTLLLQRNRIMEEVHNNGKQKVQIQKEKSLSLSRS